MSMIFSPVRCTTEWQPDLSKTQLAERAIRNIKMRIAKPDMREDVRALARGELRHWQKILREGK
jgi:hypothetical protein